MKTDWSPLIFWAACVAVIWAGDWDMPWSERVSVYWKVCESPTDGERCAKYVAGRHAEYLAVASTQVVVERIDALGGVKPLRSCAVFDRKNWKCDWYEMKDGSFTGPTAQSTTVVQVSRWRWLLLRHLGL